MNSSLWSADRITHLKIVAVALAAVIVMVGVGMSARDSNSNPVELVAKANGPVLKAGKSQSITANDISKVR
jgi:hypothetical protein